MRTTRSIKVQNCEANEIDAPVGEGCLVTTRTDSAVGMGTDFSSVPVELKEDGATGDLQNS